MRLCFGNFLLLTQLHDIGGGCTVSLVAEDQVGQFIEKIKEGYYFKKWPEWRNDTTKRDGLKDAIFASRPFVGAFVIKSGDNVTLELKKE